MACAKIDDAIEKFESFTQKPVNYLTVQTGIREDLKSFVKSLYDFTKIEERSEKRSKSSALPELIVQDFDEEQIWQQIELQNSERWDQLVWEVANGMSTKKDLVFPVNVDEPSKENDHVDQDLSEDQDLSSLEEGSEVMELDTQRKSKKDKSIASRKKRSNNVEKVDDEGGKPRKKLKAKSSKSDKRTKTSVVDDDFFKLSEMEKFLVDEEKKEGKKVAQDSDEESLQLFEDDEEEADDKDMMYTDFFDQDNDGNEEYAGSEDDGEHSGEDDFFDRKRNGYDDEDSPGEEIEHNRDEEPSSKKKKEKHVTFADGSTDDESGSSSDEEQVPNKNQDKDEKKSEFELRQQRLQQQIARLEEKNLSEAPWQLKGEVDAGKRPQNSLLQEVVDFDLTSRPAPIITEQTTLTLEDIIRRRIKDKAWDDVERKEKPVDDQLSFRKTEILDHSKSKLSLAQVYEAEYLKQKQGQSGEIEEEKEPESHTQIREAMSKLFSKLDALCHYHYTPRAPQAEVKIVSNTPAISMEEVAPVATSDAALLAPEEVKRKRRGDLIGKEERTQTDKNRERRKKKKMQRKKGQVVKVTDNRNTKKAVESSDKSLKTSKAFFQQLNDDASSMIKNKRNVKNKGQ